jgi:hypothetical protein
VRGACEAELSITPEVAVHTVLPDSKPGFDSSSVAGGGVLPGV